MSCFGRMAASAKKLHEGDTVALAGYFTTRSSMQDGIRVDKTNVVCKDIAKVE